MRSLDDKKIELSEDNLSEIEVQQIKKDMKQRIKQNSFRQKRYLKAAVIVAGVMLVGVATPTIAKNIPFVDDIYSELISVGKHKDYIQSLGEERVFDGGKIIIDNFAMTKDRAIIIAKIEMENELSDEEMEKIQLVENFDKDWNLSSGGRSWRTERVDSKSFIMEYSFTWEGHDLAREEEKFSFVLSNGEKNFAQFDIAKKAGDYVEDVERIIMQDVNNTNANIKMLEATVLDTKLTLQINGLSAEDMNKYTNFSKLKIDGTVYEHYRYGASGENYEIHQFVYDGVNSELIRNAKSIEFLGMNEEDNIKIR